MMGDGIFGNMFDFDRDGTLDAIERAIEFQFLDVIIAEEHDEDNTLTPGDDTVAIVSEPK